VGAVEPSADENAFLASYPWGDYVEWLLVLTDGAADDTKARYDDPGTLALAFPLFADGYSQYETAAYLPREADAERTHFACG